MDSFTPRSKLARRPNHRSRGPGSLLLTLGFGFARHLPKSREVQAASREAECRARPPRICVGLASTYVLRTEYSVVSSRRLCPLCSEFPRRRPHLAGIAGAVGSLKPVNLTVRFEVLGVCCLSFGAETATSVGIDMVSLPPLRCCLEHINQISVLNHPRATARLCPLAWRRRRGPVPRCKQYPLP